MIAVGCTGFGSDGAVPEAPRGVLLFVGHFLVGKSGPGSQTGMSDKPHTYRPCEAIRYRFERAGGNDAWIGFFRKASPDNEYLAWSYLRDIDIDEYEVPAPKELGDYDFRVFKDSGHDVHVRSQPITVMQYEPVLSVLRGSAEPGGEIGVRISGPSECDGAWVGLFADGAEDNSYVAYSYIRDLDGDVYRLPAPREAGVYRFRIFLDGEYTRLAESVGVTVR